LVSIEKRVGRGRYRKGKKRRDQVTLKKRKGKQEAGKTQKVQSVRREKGGSTALGEAVTCAPKEGGGLRGKKMGGKTKKGGTKAEHVFTLRLQT